MNRRPLHSHSGRRVFSRAEGVLTPLQVHQRLFSNMLEKAAEELNEREQAALKHYVIQRALVELTRTRVA